MKAALYEQYKLLCFAQQVAPQWSRWAKHRRELLKLPAFVKTPAPDTRSRQGKGNFQGVWCVHCQQDCLPLPPLQICGFCDRVAATGEYPASRRAA